MDICCPICKGKGVLNAPTFKQKALKEKEITAKSLKKQGYSIREIMRIMGYKSPQSVQKLINK